MEFKKKFVFTVLSLCIMIVSGTAQDAALDWPREIDAQKATITIYQPQIESFEGNKLQARAAVSVVLKGTSKPKFGAVWVLSRVSTDYDTRMVELLDVRITAIKFPNAKKSDETKLTQLLEKEIPKWNLNISLDRLLTGLELVKSKKSADSNIKHVAPKIIFVTYPSVLIIIDGDPKLKQLEKSKLQYIVNTPYFITFEPGEKQYYLKGSGFWFSAPNLNGPWVETKSPPKKAVEIAKQMEKKQKEQQKEQSTEGQEVDTSIVPKIFVSTEPAELIQADGDPKYIPVKGTELLYMSNSESDIFMDIKTQKFYILISGRWFTSGSITGKDWTFMNSDKLPEDFSKIPDDSDMGSVLSSVAGTEQARDAILENEIPQTAEVDRKKTTLTVKYDGKPKFKKIEGTKMSFAVNTEKSVLKIGKKYYCCSDAVWFEANKADGSWKVSDSVPEDIQSLPPSCPVYNVKYVQVYDSTPDVVYVGYTPGYYGSYVYGGSIVYGTGWHYTPWYGAHYYPRPVTWGFGVHWNPHTGWGFSFGISHGWFRVGFGAPYRGWWGVSGYRHGYRHGFYHGIHAGRRAGYRAGYRASYRHNSIRRSTSYNKNIYKRSRTTAYNRNVKTRGRYKPRPVQKPNNVYSGSKGKIYRKTGNQWQQKTKKGWKSHKSTATNKSWNQSRTRGTTRTNNQRNMSSQRSSGRRRR